MEKLTWKNTWKVPNPMFRLLKRLVLFALVALLIVFSLPYLVSGDYFKTRILKRISDETGLKVQIVGPVRWSLFPQNQFQLESITIEKEDPEDASRSRVLLEDAQALFSVPLSSLFKKEFEVKEVSFEKGRLYTSPAQVKDDLQSYFARKRLVSRKAETEATRAKKSSLHLEQISFVATEYLGPLFPRAKGIKNLNLDILLLPEKEEADGQFSEREIRVQGNGIVDHKRTHFDVLFESLEQFVKGEPTHLQGSFSIPSLGTDIDWDGDFSQPSASQGDVPYYQGAFSFSADEPSSFVYWLTGRSFPAFGELDWDSSLSAYDGRLYFEPAYLDVGDTEFSAQKIFMSFGTPDKDELEVKIEGALISTLNQNARSEVLDLSLGKVPFLKGQVIADPIRFVPSGLSEAEKKNLGAILASDDESTRRFFKTLLEEVQIDLDVSAPSFEIKASEVKDFSAGALKGHFLSQKGKGTFKLESWAFQNTVLTGEVDFSIQSDPYLYGLSLHSNSPTLLSDLSWAFGNENTAQGGGKFSVELKTQGRTVKDFSEMMEGKVSAFFKEAHVSGMDLEKELKSFGSRHLRVLYDSQEKTKFDFVDLMLEGAEGVFPFSFLRAETGKYKFWGEGEVDLISQAFDFRLRSSDKETSYISLPLTFGGYWQKPKLTIGLPLK